ncbi:MAG TPA: GspH/FimT family pseudopilin [Lacunisphaera sp.]|nr:GspH/FimT family pseudopilin [Lacunisphaera sp.]
MFRQGSSGGRRSPGRRRPAAGFSLVEIIAVLAILGLVSALLLGSGGEYLRHLTRDDVETVALDAIASARHSAVLTGQPLELRYDEKNRRLDWQQGQAAIVGEGEVRLLPPARLSAMLVGGREVEKPLERVIFYPDGTCQPFRVEIVRDQASEVLPIDPWTCSVLAKDPDAGKR